MSLENLLIELSEASGVSGHEDAVSRIVAREMEPFADEISYSRLGSVIALKRATRTRRHKSRASQSPKLLFEAHIDEIGLMVTALDRGVIRFVAVGSFDPRVLLAQDVLVHGRETLPGIIGARPPHVLTAEERGKPVPLNDLFIDVGLSDARLRALVSVGDTITIDRRVSRLCNGRFAGKAFDDRCAVVAVIEALKQLSQVEHGWDIYAVANVQEEHGTFYPGAFTSTFQVRPDVAIALDVTHAEQPGMSAVNAVALGKGPGLALGPNIHHTVHTKLMQVARSREIPHQITAYAGSTGTDAWAMQVVSTGIPTGLLDLPLRYMHTSVETIALADIEYSARLLAAFSAELDESFYRDLQVETKMVARGATVSRRRMTGGKHQ